MGYSLDIVSSPILGLNAFAMSLVFLAVYLSSRSIWMHHPIVSSLVVLLAALVKGAALVVVWAIFLTTEGFWTGAARYVIMEALMAAVLAPWFSRCCARGQSYLENLTHGLRNKNDDCYLKSINKTARRRFAGARLLYLLVAMVFFGIIARLVFLQVIQGERYTFLSENNRVRIKSVPGTRGMIYDRQGELLVDSRPSFDLIFVPEDSEGIRKRHCATWRSYLRARGERTLENFEAKQKPARVR